MTNTPKIHEDLGEWCMNDHYVDDDLYKTTIALAHAFIAHTDIESLLNKYVVYVKDLIKKCIKTTASNWGYYKYVRIALSELDVDDMNNDHPTSILIEDIYKWSNEQWRSASKDCYIDDELSPWIEANNQFTNIIEDAGTLELDDDQYDYLDQYMSANNLLLHYMQLYCNEFDKSLDQYRPNLIEYE